MTDKSKAQLRMEISLSAEHSQALNMLMEKHGLESHKELFNIGMSLLYWVSQEMKSSRKIGSFEQDLSGINSLVIPGLNKKG